MPAPLHVVILAAGQGTRMKSARPKVLHEVGGQPLLAHVMETAHRLSAKAIHVVHGHGAGAVRQWFEAAHPGGRSTRGPVRWPIRWVLQAQQKGTAHAVLQALPGIPDRAQVLVLYGDVPLVRPETLKPLTRSPGLTLLTATLAHPQGYGRILRDASGAAQGIVEEKDATAAQRRITEINTGILAAPARLLKRWLPKIGNRNTKREHYLTDIVTLAVRDGVGVRAQALSDADEILGVNDRGQLAQAERLYQRRQAVQLMKEGLTLRDPEHFALRGTLQFGRDVTLDAGVILEGEIRLGDGVQIGPYSVLKNATLGAGTRVESHSVMDSVTVGKNCRIGPYARLRPETVLADGAHIGNFVEVKKSRIGAGSKANHLAYLGDSIIGARVNVGAGTITCNYDGANKHVTVIEDDVFIGSDTQLVAPVKIGKGATIGAGSTITKDVPPGGLSVCRAKEQRSYPHWKRPVKRK